MAGVVGTVADLLEVPPGLERAMEAVLGERLQWVVVERFEDARAAVSYLREQGAGGGDVLASRSSAEWRPSRPSSRPITASPAGRRAQVGGASSALVHHLLGSVPSSTTSIRPKRSGAATAWWPRTSPRPARCWRRPDGCSGGAGDAGERGAEHSLLGRKRELRELEDEVARLDRRRGRGADDGGRSSAPR